MTVKRSSRVTLNTPKIPKPAGKTTKPPVPETLKHVTVSISETRPSALSPEARPLGALDEARPSVTGETAAISSMLEIPTPSVNTSDEMNNTQVQPELENLNTGIKNGHSPGRDASTIVHTVRSDLSLFETPMQRPLAPARHAAPFVGIVWAASRTF
ncbi:hypothetical protein BD779DRAFT_1671499 [Infundibulicybe gibba]|nr:hypothetical protein BD779DRAFT_1671499 [Infundibulicybe gibba]